MVLPSVVPVASVPPRALGTQQDAAALDAVFIDDADNPQRGVTTLIARQMHSVRLGVDPYVDRGLFLRHYFALSDPRASVVGQLMLNTRRCGQSNVLEPAGHTKGVRRRIEVRRVTRPAPARSAAVCLRLSVLLFAFALRDDHVLRVPAGLHPGGVDAEAGTQARRDVGNTRDCRRCSGAFTQQR